VRWSRVCTGAARDIGPETIAEIQTQVRHRLLRYCARPAFALERLREIDAERFGL
jgi:hypothetical protein